MVVLSIIYLAIVVLAIVFIVWFVKTLNAIKQSLLRVEMKLMGYDPVTGAPATGKRLE